MVKEIEQLIEMGYTIEQILTAAHDLKKNEVIRCLSCNSRLCDLDQGIVVIKCRCGEYTKIT